MKLRFLKPAIFGILLLGIPLLFFFLPNFIKINRVECKSQYGPCGVYLENKITQAQGLSLRGAKAKLSGFLKSETQVEDFSLHYKIPDKLVIDVVLAKPKFALKKENEPEFALVNKDGVVLRWEDSTNLPFVETSEAIPNVGETVTSGQIFALSLMYEVFSTYQSQSGEIKNGSLVIAMTNGLTVIFPQEGDKDALLGSLALVLAKLNENTKDSNINVREIDLRFKNPVLR